MYNGIIVIDKEPGYTSSDVVSKLRGILKMKKIGHTGTLDPEATGVLPVCLGSATRLTEMITDHEKEYTAVLRLGVITDTQDMTGTVLEEAPAEQVLAVSRQQFLQAAGQLTGEILQVPPMYSAIRVGGQHLYELARKGQIVERAPRSVVIHELQTVSFAPPLATIRVRCSKGTYIRTLCEDLGKLLGTGAAMESLRRTRVGQFTLDDALTISEVEKLVKETGDGIGVHLIPVDRFFREAPALCVKEASLLYLKNGNPMRWENTDAGEQLRELAAAAAGEKPFLLRMYDSAGNFHALYRYEKETGGLAVYKMFPQV